MIAVCDPQATHYSHEKVNSGFLYGLRLAYPLEKILFYTHSTHIQAIKNILIHDKIALGDIEYIPVEYNDTFSIKDYKALCNNIFSDVISNKINKIFFLSFSPKILYVIKRIKQKKHFRCLKFTLVFHWNLEKIATDKPEFILLPFSLPLKISTDIATLAGKTEKKITLQRITGKLKRELRKTQEVVDKYLRNKYTKIINRFLNIRCILFWRNSPDYKYIVLSPHILTNAAKFIDLQKLDMRVVVLPTSFAPDAVQPINANVKFAVFGNGKPLMLYNIMLLLQKKNIQRDYEVRIIGMTNSILGELPHVNCPSPDKGLSRVQMESYAKDIDVFLILYDKNEYRLSCTNSILEAISYTKPVLHFNSDCINTFNRPGKPIGIGCDSLEEYAGKMEDIIEHYEDYSETFAGFRQNIQILRTELAISNSVNAIKESFTWN